MAEIRVHRNGTVALVDDEDLDRISGYHWWGHLLKGKKWEIYTRIDNKRMSLSRFILCPPQDLQVDHINGNRLDNRRSNLRICTRSENLRNRHTTWGCCHYKGVTFEKRRGLFRAQIKFNNKHHNLGYFKHAHNAALAYDRAALSFYGDFARINSDIFPPPEPAAQTVSK